jgi:hypothetical protein
MAGVKLRDPCEWCGSVAHDGEDCPEKGKVRKPPPLPPKPRKEEVSAGVAPPERRGGVVREASADSIRGMTDEQLRPYYNEFVRRRMAAKRRGE